MVCVMATSGTNLYTAPAGWYEFVNSPQIAASNDPHMCVFWKRATSSSETNPTIADVASDDAKIAVVFTVRGVNTTGVPWNVILGGIAASNTAVSCPSGTTTLNNCLVVNIVAHGVDVSSTNEFSSWANANLTSGTEHFDEANPGGGGYGLGIYSGVLATAGAFTNTTATLASASRQSLFTIAFRTTWIS